MPLLGKLITHSVPSLGLSQLHLGKISKAVQRVYEPRINVARGAALQQSRRNNYGKLF